MEDHPKIVGILHKKDKITSQTLEVVDLLEIRCDLYSDLIKAIDVIKQCKNTTDKPLIGTIRHPKEGGFLAKKAPNESERLKWFEKMIPYVDIVDIELQCEICDDVINLAKNNGKKVIVSYHNFKGTPLINKLESYLEESIGKQADIFKITTKADSFAALQRILEFTSKHAKNFTLITMCTGKFGKISRILTPLFGCAFIYGFISTPLYQGQLSVFDLKKCMDHVFQIKKILALEEVFLTKEEPIISRIA